MSEQNDIQTPQAAPSAPTSSTASSATATGTLAAFSDQLADVVKTAGRGIVTVAARPRQSATGILWKAENETVILTADHVIEREDDITIGLPGGRSAKAQLVGRDPGTDIAVLRLTGGDLGTDAAPLATGDEVRVGSLVFAVGRPGSDGPRVSFGAISSLEGPRRSWQGGEIEQIIFADVTLYPGFSGGPLVDLHGRVVGMSSSHLTRQSGSALPVATLRRVTNTILAHGRVRRGYLGVGTQQVPLPAALAQRANTTQESALLVATVESGSPAEQAGILLGDLLVKLGGQPVTDVDALRAQLGGDRLGQAITLTVIRGGEPREVNVTIAERQ